MATSENSTVIEVQNGQNILLEAASADLFIFSQNASDLVITTISDGNSVTLEGFFTQATTDLPPLLTLSNGTIITALEAQGLVEEFDPTLVLPAGGGATGGGDGGGAGFGEYEDDGIGDGLDISGLLDPTDLDFPDDEIPEELIGLALDTIPEDPEQPIFRINEIGIGTDKFSDDESDLIGQLSALGNGAVDSFLATAGSNDVSYIELFNYTDSEQSTGGNDGSEGNDGILTLTFIGEAGVPIIVELPTVTVPAGGRLVLMQTNGEGGSEAVFVVFDASGTAIDGGAVPGVGDVGTIFGDTSDPLGVILSWSFDGTEAALDTFLANGAAFDGDTIDHFWDSVPGATVALDIFGDNETFNGQISTQEVVAPGIFDAYSPISLALLLECSPIAETFFLDIDVNNIYSRVDNFDSDTAADWTTGQTPTIGTANDIEDLNPQDPYNDDMNPGQAAGPDAAAGEDTDSNGQNIIIVGTNSADFTDGETGVVEGGRAQDFLFGDSDENTLDGGFHNDFLDGGAGNDMLFGSSGGDVIIDDQGQDMLIGGTGTDILFGRRGAGEEIEDTLTGGQGNDFPNDLPLVAAVAVVDEENGLEPGNEDGAFEFGTGDLLIGDEIMEGGFGNDFMYGGQGNDVMYGGGGNDSIDGVEDDQQTYMRDIIVAGDGSDIIYGDNAGLEDGFTPDDIDALYSDIMFLKLITGPYNFAEAYHQYVEWNYGGADLIYGGWGNDIIFGQGGDDAILAGHGDDIAAGGSGADKIRGNDGNDSLYGDTGDDTMLGDAGNDIMLGGFGNDSMIGGSGNDDIYGNDGNDDMAGGTGNDSMKGGGGEDVMSGDDDGDFMGGGGGNDLMYGDAGNDDMAGDSGDDTMDGGTGNDFMLGGIGNDSMLGGANNDNMYGDNDGDFMDGGTGNDYMSGGFGNDTMMGGANNDTMHGNDQNDDMDGGTGNDFMYGGFGNDDMDGGTGNDFMHGGSGNDTMMGGDDSDTMFGDSNNDNMDGGTGNDYMQGGSGNDTMFGGDDGDTMFGNDQNDDMDGGTGDDYMYGNSGNDDMDGGANNDFMVGGSGNDDMDGGTGDDVMHGGFGNDAMDGGANNDVMYGNDQNDVMDGGTGNDFMDGGTGNDMMSGNADDDTMTGNDGSDIVDGNGGDDVLQWTMSTNTVGSNDIYDGNGDTDTLELYFTLAEFNAHEAAIAEFSNRVENGEVGVVLNVGGRTLTASNIEYVAVHIDNEEVPVLIDDIINTDENSDLLATIITATPTTPEQDFVPNNDVASPTTFHTPGSVALTMPGDAAIVFSAAGWAQVGNVWTMALIDGPDDYGTLVFDATDPESVTVALDIPDGPSIYAPLNNEEQATVVFDYSATVEAIEDATVTINVTGISDSVVAVDDIVVTNVAGDIYVPKYAMLVNDSTDSDDPLFVDTLTPPATHADDYYVQYPVGGVAESAYGYEASDGNQSGAADVEVHYTEGHYLKHLVDDETGLDLGYNEIMIGGAGADTISGGDGEDTMIGGVGNDVMDAGTGADTFHYVSSGDGEDEVYSFDESEDIINLDALFDVLGVVSAEARADLVYIDDNGSDSIVTVNGEAGFSITLVGVSLDDHEGDLTAAELLADKGIMVSDES